MYSSLRGVGSKKSNVGHETSGSSVSSIRVSLNLLCDMTLLVAPSASSMTAGVCYSNLQVSPSSATQSHISLKPALRDSCIVRAHKTALAVGAADSTTSSSTITSVLLEQECSAKSSLDAAVNTAKLVSPQLERSSYPKEDPSLSPQASTTSWKATRASKRTTRRRALAICLALVTVTQHAGQGQEQVNMSAAHAQNLITLSSTAGDASPPFSPANWESYGDLVTVSTGTSVSSSDGLVKGLPSWLSGNYHLCLGDGFHVQLPAHWHMHDTEGRSFGTVLRYEDRADPSTNVIVLKSPTSQSRTDDLGDPKDWIRDQAYLLTGSNEPLQFEAGEEGTNAATKIPSRRLSVAKVLNVDKAKNKQGLTYYTYEIVTKQGGKQDNLLHELVSAVVNDGNLYMCRVQTDEGRWQKGTEGIAQRIVDSFQITGFKIHV